MGRADQVLGKVFQAVGRVGLALRTYWAVGRAHVVEGKRAGYAVENSDRPVGKADVV